MFRLSCLRRKIFNHGTTFDRMIRSKTPSLIQALIASALLDIFRANHDHYTLFRIIFSGHCRDFGLIAVPYRMFSAPTMMFIGLRAIF